MLDRLADGEPPLRIGEFAEMAGYAPFTIRKMVDAGAIEMVKLPGTEERRIPVSEARRILEDLRVIPSHRTKSP